MMRVRLLIVVGIFFTLSGVILGAASVSWMFGPHIYDPDGPFAQHLSMARLALIVATVVATAGIVMMAAAAIIWRRAHSVAGTRADSEEGHPPQFADIGYVIARRVAAEIKHQFPLTVVSARRLEKVPGGALVSFTPANESGAPAVLVVMPDGRCLLESDGAYLTDPHPANEPEDERVARIVRAISNLAVNGRTAKRGLSMRVADWMHHREPKRVGPWAR